MQPASRLQQRVADATSYMQHALAVMAHCAGDSSTVQLVQAMADIARTALSCDTAADTGGAGGDAAIDVQLSEDEGFSEDEFDEGDEDEAAQDILQQQQEQEQQERLQRYLELQQQVLVAACGSSSEGRQVLDAMEVIARRAIQQQW